MKKKCLECQIEYKIYPYELTISKFCSRKCQNVNWGKNHRGDKNLSWKGGINAPSNIKIICQQCHTPFIIKRNRKKTAKYCSLTCGGEAKTSFYLLRRKEFICIECSEIFYHKPTGKYPYCSSKCRASGVGKQRIGIPMSTEACQNMSKAQIGKPKFSMRGNKHWNWMGGKSKTTKTARNIFMQTLEYKIWRRTIFERDNYTCQKCGVHGGTLNADHIKPYAYFPALRLDVDNGRTLCVSCHRATQTWGFKAISMNKRGEFYASL